MVTLCKAIWIDTTRQILSHGHVHVTPLMTLDDMPQNEMPSNTSETRPPSSARARVFFSFIHISMGTQKHQDLVQRSIISTATHLTPQEIGTAFLVNSRLVGSKLYPARKKRALRPATLETCALPSFHALAKALSSPWMELCIIL